MVTLMTQPLTTDKKLLVELAIMLALKLLLLFLIWHLFFSAAPDSINADAMSDALLNNLPQGDSP